MHCSFYIYLQYFVTDCIGIAFVGVAAMLYALFNAMSAVATGKIMVYTSRTVLSMCTMMWSTVLCSFMLLWERQSSYAAAFVLAASIGVSNGSWTTLGAGEYLLAMEVACMQCFHCTILHIDKKHTHI